MTEQAQDPTSAPQPTDGVPTSNVPVLNKDTTAAKNLVAQLANTAAVAAETADANELMMSALTDIANATSADELFAANETGGVPSLRDSDYLIGVPLSIVKVEFVKSSDEYAESGLGTFVIVTAMTDKSEEIQFNTGASNVVGTFFQAEKLGLISQTNPWRVVMNAKKTANGTLFRVGQPKI